MTYVTPIHSDEMYQAAWRRKAYALRNMGRVDKSVEELTTLLDTFYSEVDGWVELAEIYYLCKQYGFIPMISPEAHADFRYDYALRALSQALLLAPQNPFYVLEFAEIAYASGDLPLAVKTFLMAVDMTDDEDAPVTSHETDITLRAWYGVKLVRHIREIMDRDSRPPQSLRRLAPDTQSPSQTAPPANAELIDKLATERLRHAYVQRTKGAQTPHSEDDLLEWASTTLKPPPHA
jgi:tetratricopeptide (TPR) repeat protein